MRLLHANDFTFHEFFDEIPPYAILSHRWGDDEVTLKDMQKRWFVPNKEGFKKIRYCANQALKDGFKYIWVDTCCILKTSSAELSEAINSMYRWYKNSELCYVYLADVRKDNWEAEFRKSRWFTRGWTLQELLAPRKVYFYTVDWTYIGSKRKSMAPIIAEITGINQQYLNGSELERVSIAERMSWASRRNTSRLEDAAYCLLGIFNVNMPLLYGEGGKAFLRLQEEIMKHSEDRSLFAWVKSKEDGSTVDWADLKTWTRSHSSEQTTDSGLLAPSPRCFTLEVQAQFGFSSVEHYIPFVEPYSMTNKGLCISLQLAALDPQNDIYVVELARRPQDKSRYGAFLRCISSLQKRFSRMRIEDIVLDCNTITQPFVPETVYVAPSSDSNYQVIEIIANLSWDIKFPDFCSAAALKLVRSVSSLHGLYINDGDETQVVLDPGDTCALSYLIELFNVQFYVLLCCTKAGRCLFSIEQESGSPAERLVDEWRPSRWEVIRPSSLNGLVVVKTLEYGRNKFEIRVFTTNMHEHGSVDFRLELRMGSEGE